MITSSPIPGGIPLKKKIASLFCTALIISTFSAALAATNPFSDVPAGHWAYEAVAKLAADGVIDGYGDGTFRGNREITRYEMAQMTARAMAKNPSGADKALVDRLAAEFSEELRNLGVRISNLEQHADSIQWHGELRYTYLNMRRGDNKLNTDMLLLRLEPKAEINDRWTLHTRIDTEFRMDRDAEGKAALKRAWAEGRYDNFNIKVGKIPDTVNYDRDMMLFGQFSGVEINIGNKPLTAQFRAGRIGLDDVRYTARNIGYGGVLTKQNDDAADFRSAALTYSSGKLSLTGAYYYLNADWFRNVNYSKDGTTDSANIWEAAATYTFSKNLLLTAAYAKNLDADYYAHSHIIQLGYKGVKPAHAGTLGSHIAYRYIASNTSIDPQVAGMFGNAKGLEAGFAYIPFKHMLFRTIYADGRDLQTNKKARKVFIRCEWFF